MHETAGNSMQGGTRRDWSDCNIYRLSFLLPNIYYFGFEVHTVDLFFRCKVNDISTIGAHDDVEELLFLAPGEINPAAFGLASIRKGIEKIIQIVI